MSGRTAIAKIIGLCAMIALWAGAAWPAQAETADRVAPSLARPLPHGGDFFGRLRSAFGAKLIEREAPYGAPVEVRVSLGAQEMIVEVGGGTAYRWPVSSGRIGYNTPHGSYRPQRLAVMWRSRKYHMSPMPHSIFFRGGYAIHGTYATAYLGARASHGCIRLAPANAATLFDLVRAAGFLRTRIVIEG